MNGKQEYCLTHDCILRCIDDFKKSYCLVNNGYKLIKYKQKLCNHYEPQSKYIEQPDNTETDRTDYFKARYERIKYGV